MFFVVAVDTSKNTIFLSVAAKNIIEDMLGASVCRKSPTSRHDEHAGWNTAPSKGAVGSSICRRAYEHLWQDILD